MPCCTRLSPTQLYPLRKSTGPQDSFGVSGKALATWIFSTPHLEMDCDAMQVQGGLGAMQLSTACNEEVNGSALLRSQTTHSQLLNVYNSESQPGTHFSILSKTFPPSCWGYLLHKVFFFFSHLLNTFFFSLAVILSSRSFPLKSHASVSSPCSGTHQTRWCKHVQK